MKKKSKPMKPKRLTSKRSREMARQTRDSHWRFMERVAALGTLWFCIWNKYRREELVDEHRDCLIGGLEIQEWIDQHPDWWIVGEWSDERYARPLQLTDAGRLALTERAKYDMEPVTGGLVEPGFIVTPARPRRAA